MKALLAKLSLAVIGAALALLLLEAALRVFPERPASVIVEADPAIGTRYVPNLDVEIPAEGGKGTVRFLTNSKGFVFPPWRSDRPDIRIGNFGDSFTAGAAVPYEKNYVSLLEASLEEKTGKDVEGLNFGVGGQGIDDALSTYRAYGREARPDLVLLWVYLGNDFHDTLEGATVKDPETASSWDAEREKRRSFFAELLGNSSVKALLASSEFVHRAVGLLRAVPGFDRLLYGVTLGDPPSEIRLIFTDDSRNGAARLAAEEAVSALAREARADGVSLVLIAVPAHFQVDPSARAHLFSQYPVLEGLGFDPLAPNRMLAEIAEEENVPFIDLTPTFTGECGASCGLYVCRFCHFSVDGHALAARVAADELVARGIVK